MKIVSVVCFVLAALLGIGGFLHASKPSYSPIITVIGSFVLPALFAWWGTILWKKASKKEAAENEPGGV